MGRACEDYRIIFAIHLLSKRQEQKKRHQKRIAGFVEVVNQTFCAAESGFTIICAVNNLHSYRKSTIVTNVLCKFASYRRSHLGIRVKQQ